MCGCMCVSDMDGQSTWMVMHVWLLWLTTLFPCIMYRGGWWSTLWLIGTWWCSNNIKHRQALCPFHLFPHVLLLSQKMASFPPNKFHFIPASLCFPFSVDLHKFNVFTQATHVSYDTMKWTKQNYLRVIWTNTESEIDLEQQKANASRK